MRGGGGQAQQMIDEMANRVDEGVRWAQLLDTCKKIRLVEQLSVVKRADALSVANHCGQSDEGARG